MDRVITTGDVAIAAVAIIGAIVLIYAAVWVLDKVAGYYRD